MAERLHIGGDAAKHVQAYLEYQAIVGNDDGGVLMSEQEFEAYKARVREKRKNRLYVHWRNMETGRDCKAIGPASQCFCGHRFKEHDFDAVENKRVKCKDKKCKCKLFDYIPVFGSQDFKCYSCKHSCHEHDPVTHKCTRPNCRCTEFFSRHACSCGGGYNLHQTVFERREEREANGRPVDAAWMQESNMVAGMGGLQHQDFQSLLDDQDRQEFRDPGAIMGNMYAALEGGSNQRLAIKGGPAAPKRAPAGGASKPKAQRQVVAAHESAGADVDLLELFNTPHSYGGGGDGGIGEVTGKMRRLKM